jgi:CRISPR-associated endonuclease Csn1
MHMETIFALDLGIASVGSSVVKFDDNSGQILFAGARTFPQAENPKDGSSLALPRRLARSARRRLRRRRYRLDKIIEILTRIGLPISGAENENPYALRAEGLDRLLTPVEWARALLHLAKRRGFKSNRKSEAKENEEAGKQLTAIAANKTLLKSYRTVGEMLYRAPEFATHKRNKQADYGHTVARADLLAEAHQLFVRQRELGNLQSGEALKEEYCRWFEAQRPFDAGNIAAMIGSCAFEHGELRAAKASWSFERAMLLQKINHLAWSLPGGDRQFLSNEQRTALLNLSYKQADVKFHQIRKLIDLPDSARFAGLNYRSNQTADSDDASEKAVFAKLAAWHTLRLAVSKHVGDIAWGNLSQRSDWLDAIGTALTYFKSDTTIQAELEKSGVPDEYHDTLLTLSFSKVGHLSLKALSRLMPHLEKGLRYDEAATEEYGDFRRMGADTKQELLPLIPADDIRNPVVYRALTQARKVLNALIREYGTPSRVHIEVGRDLARSFKDRGDIKKEQDKYRLEKDKVVASFVKDFGGEPRGDQLTKWRLWHQQNGYCLYSGTYLEPAQLFAEGYAEVDHILPYSRSFDDSLNNKVICTSKANREKRNRTPMEWLAETSGEAATHEFEIRVNACKSLKKAKRDRLLRRHFEEDAARDFRDRHLNDTRYITRFFKNFVEDNLLLNLPQGVKQGVTASAGELTAFLRAQWGLYKVRSDNDRHHALDALVLACVRPALVNRIADYSKHRELYGKGARARMVNPNTGEVVNSHYHADDRFPLPWPAFRENVIEALGQVFVSRPPRKKATGAMHDATILSAKRMVDGVAHKRISLTALKPAQLENLVDKDTRNQRLYTLLKQRLEAHANKPEKAFAAPVYLPPENGETTENAGQGRLVRGVRIVDTLKSGMSVRNGVAANGEMLRVDVFRKAGKHYLVPIYLGQMGQDLPRKAMTANKPEKDWREIDDSYEFRFSLHKDDLIEIEHKGQPIIGYFDGADRSTAAIALDAHDGAERFRSIGVQSLSKFEKRSVDLLGRLGRVRGEQRIGLAKRSDQPPSAADN